jgi:NTP pyrophosphatase (non-canonical NTP hydrolase)
MTQLTLAELTEAMHAFVHDKGWYESESQRPQTLRNLAISLSLEAAEVLEHFQWRDAAPGEVDREALASELADVALYLLQIASISGIDLEQAILDKLRLNYGRTWDK